MVFRDRRHAGALLAAQLLPLRSWRWYRDFSPVGDAEVLALLGAEAEQPTARPGKPSARELHVTVDGVELAGDLAIPPQTRGLVIFAHGSVSSRLSPRNRAVAAALNDAGFATLLFDLLTAEEAARRELVFHIPLLARRLELITRWALEQPETSALPIGYFGASTGAAATLLVVGSRDPQVLDLNRRAAAMLRCPQRVVVVEGAGHLFEEPGTLETVARLAADWFEEHLHMPEPRLAATGS